MHLPLAAARPHPGKRTYRRREPEQTALYRTLQHHLETFLADTAEAGSPLPRFVERELRRFLRCGILAHGFARVRCSKCRFEHLVAFSCKGRGFCPSCGGKRMARIAAHLVDHVVPPVGVRQWVLSLPHRLRYRLGYDHALCTEVLGAFSAALMGGYRRRAERLGIAAGRSGAITFIQRFGSSLNLNVHFHTQALDGVFTEQPDGTLAFHALPPPTDAEVRDVLEEVACRLGPILGAHGLDDDFAPDALGEEDPTLAACLAGSVQHRTALGPRAGRGPVRIGADPDATWIEKHIARHAHLDGLDLHANVAVPAGATARLEQLLRYCARPAISHDRLSLLDDGRVVLELKTPWFDGTTHMILRPDELIQRLVALVPRPDKNLLRYHGVLAPNAKWRARVVAYKAPSPSGPSGGVQGGGLASRAEASTASPNARSSRPNNLWAYLMQRAFDIDVLDCPRCGSRMRLIALVRDTHVARRILRHLGMRDHAPPITPPRTPHLDWDHVA